ncbi:ketol-acid reductoisomerase [Kamptonema cortianum]|nr:ketol-acid reductoisomerase [Geitlerinema splendidum]MDK3156947.1 ketol-acid reductoisomerase [Kamptonema cortianum]
MARFIEASEFDESAAANLRYSVVGYGNQGRAHALNLRDSGRHVVVGAREGGSGYQQALADGFEPVALAEAVKSGEVVMLSLPDMVLPEIWSTEIESNLMSGQTLLFAHGFNVVYNLIDFGSKVDIGLVSPKGAGAKLRSEFLEGRGLAALVSVHQDVSGQAWQRVLSYSHGIGSFRCLVMETTFREETHTDLFGEQTVLCGGIPELLKSAFNTLVDAGYSPEAAYFECVHEAKLITDLIYARGLAGMRQAISDTAEWGGLTVGQSIVGSATKTAMKEALDAIQSGEFAEEWSRECRAGQNRLKELESEESRLPVEQVGAHLRQQMGIE